MAAATAARFTLGHRSVASWAARTEPLLGETAPKNGQVATALLPLRPCAAEVGERSGFPSSPRRWRWCGRKHDPHAEEEPLCGEDPPAVRIMAELGSVQERSAEVDVENRRSFSLALMALFDIGHADAFDLITVDEDRQFLLGQRCPDGPRGIMQGVDQSLADRERRRLERGVLKRSSSPERATTATRSSSGLGAGDEEENGGDDGRDADFVPSAGISAQSACSPKRRRTPIMTPSSLTMTLTLT
ncbi:hypothetical protein GWK47_037422 [Chionoecetes opilio]|uniref:Uncharacterized protein n=1 Tax=Chionoecetes opilio TaxID=41210 RepID=A0A8J4YEX3_CHIOP|nr:hypothetical protein GWK47_037422 [Chionoecetes opilio]